jgi:hypothetical protein
MWMEVVRGRSVGKVGKRRGEVRKRFFDHEGRRSRGERGDVGVEWERSGGTRRRVEEDKGQRDKEKAIKEVEKNIGKGVTRWEDREG